MAVVHVNEQTFHTEIEKATGLSLVDFWSPSCGPCMMLGPVIEELANDVGDRAKIAKLNVDEAQELALQFGVMSIPTLIVFKDGQEIARRVGVQPKKQILELLGIA